jgi:hypothetical protein
MNYQVVDLKICYRNTETERRDMQLTVLLDEWWIYYDFIYFYL